MRCTTEFPDRVELVRAELAGFGYGLVIVAAQANGASAWTARLTARTAAGPRPAGEAAGVSADAAADAALALARELGPVT